MNNSQHIEIRHALEKFQHLDKAGISYILDLYQTLDNAIERFKIASGLKCITNCGHCCKTNYVETTALELMPLAINLWLKKETQYWLKRASMVDRNNYCIFYQPHPSVRSEGNCSIYPFRPLICRLFGFSTRNNKYGRPKLITCAYIKKAHPSAYKKAQQLTATENLVPAMTDYIMRISLFGSEQETRQLTINEAAETAIEKIELIMDLQNTAQD